jgi:chaperonin GroEL
LNKLKGNVRVCCVKCPGFGNNRKNQLEDIGILTKGEVIDPELGMSFESVDVDILGACKKIIIGKDDTIVIDGAGDKKDIQNRVDQILGEIENSTSEYDKEKLQERQAKLQGGVGVIKVGGATEVEVKEIKDRLNDAIMATRCALDEGIVVGGGAALLYASLALNNLKMENFDQQHAVKIIQ